MAASFLRRNLANVSGGRLAARSVISWSHAANRSRSVGDRLAAALATRSAFSVRASPDSIDDPISGIVSPSLARSPNRSARFEEAWPSDRITSPAGAPDPVFSRR